MLLSIVIALMVSMGILGGSVNYILPANTDPATGKKVRNRFNCMILGIGATILVPDQGQTLLELIFHWMKAFRKNSGTGGRMPGSNTLKSVLL